MALAIVGHSQSTHLMAAKTRAKVSLGDFQETIVVRKQQKWGKSRKS